MTTFPASVGAKAFVGYAAEATAGTPVGATDYLQLDPDKSTLDYTQGRSVAPYAAGSIFAEQFPVEGEANAGGVIAGPVFPSLSSKLLFLSGFMDTKTGSGPYLHTATYTKPKPITVEFNRAGKSLQYAGQYPKSMKLSCSSKSPILAFEMTLMGLGKPTNLSPSTIVVPFNEIPYEWKHLGAGQLLSGSAFPDIDDWELEWMFDLQEFRGANTTAMPTSIVVGISSVQGKFTKLFKDDADYTQYVTEGETPATLIFNFTQSVGATDQLQFTLTSAIYESHDWKQPLKGMIVEEFGFHAVDLAATPSLAMVNKNADNRVYSAT